MTEHFDALNASDKIRGAYRNYLLTSNDFSDALIREEFSRLLEDSYPLTKGPFVQVTPLYRKSKSLNELAKAGLLSTELLTHPTLIPNADRPLYQHQVSAIEKISAGRNVIVATGTGSGKTEAFLLPIINSLLEERRAGTLSQPGVRALLLYPMNALANDQLERLRELLANLPDITFGRYTGEIGNEDEARQFEDFRRRYGKDPIPNEMLSRQRMRDTPPHILLSNFSMLEYLLIRPVDTNFFDGETGKHWRFIVLDEVHTYQGAKGGEIRMLLKRLRDRVVMSVRDRITYIGTSATIGSLESDMPKLANYASLLFDETVAYSTLGEVCDIVRPQFEKHREYPREVTLTVNQIAEIHRTVVDNDQAGLSNLLGSHLKENQASLSVRQGLGSLLSRESTFQTLLQSLNEGPKPIGDIVESLGSLSASRTSVGQLIYLAKYAETPGEATPLLSARYHLFLRALEGMFLCYNPTHPNSQPRMSLEPHEHCPACSRSEPSAMFEIGPCVQCGSSYLIGKVTSTDAGPKLGLAAPYGTDNVYLSLVAAASSGDIDVDEDEDAFAAGAGIEGENHDVRTLCLVCGALDEGVPTCGHKNAWRKVIHTKPKNPDSPMRKCVVCSYQSSGTAVNRVQTGQDAPNSILASAVYQQLPEAPDMSEAVGGGRKLLCFSDSRQDAAFFAPYLERTYMRNVQRRLLLDSLQAADEVVRFEDLVGTLARQARESRVLSDASSDSSPEVEVRKWMIREALNLEGRQSLIGTGLIRIEYRMSDDSVPDVLIKSGFNRNESAQVLQVLLQTMREKGAIDIPVTIDITDPVFSPRNFISRMRQISDGPILGWSPKEKRTNSRLNYLSRLLDEPEESDKARKLLQELWDELTPRNSKWHHLFKVDGKGKVPSLCLDYKVLNFTATKSTTEIFECDTCRRVSLYNVRGICPRYRCVGKLQLGETKTGRREQYEKLYSEQLKIGMNVEEHTGQLSNKRASDVQQQFVEGSINTLSCSTTFELGVDLGEIRAVLMKNVPPTAANYSQRAGRAGRRTSSTALVTTFAQRRNHDLFYFAHPEQLVKGVVQAPQISVTNTLIIRRHVHSVALSAFARHVVGSGEEWPRELNVGEFFYDQDSGGQTMATRFESWLRTRPDQLGDSLKRIVDDPPTSSELGIGNWGWIDDLYLDTNSNEKGWMRKAETIIREHLTDIGALIREKEEEARQLPAGSQRALAIARSLGILQKQANTIRSRKLVDYLAQRIVLPKYGFPVDVVTLDIFSPSSTAGADIDLSRDLQMGILEFAPGSTTVANKLLWEANGLRIPPDKVLPEFEWRICSKCGTFRTVKELDSGCDVCGSHENTPHVRAIVPTFGFLGKPSSQKPGDARPSRVGSLRSYFTEFTGQMPDLENVEIGNQSVGVRVGREAVVTVLNQGPRNSGFEVCLRCGGAQPPTKVVKKRKTSQPDKLHKRPGIRGHDCTNRQVRRALGHQFRTDAIQIDLPGVVTYQQGESVLAALLAATEKLDIPRDDLKGASRASGGGGSRSIVIYDAVPGGAGYARAVRDALGKLFDEAAAITQNCSCGEETACYGCLRSYANQYVHQELSRRKANEVFAALGLVDLT